MTESVESQMLRELTAEEAIALGKLDWWCGMDPREVFALQAFQPLLCMNFGDFHGATEAALGRPVWTHEFADPERLFAEFIGAEPTPSDPNRHAVDSLAALMLARRKDPDTQMIVVGGEG